MTLLVLVKVGSRNETREINGASHFIEHLMFKGTKRRPTTQHISRELDRYGAEYNAYTDKDVTGYYIKMDAEKLPLAIDMLHDMLFRSRFDSKEMNRERGVIIEEINMYEDNPRMHIDDLLEGALFPNSTLGWNIAGPREIIKTIPRDMLISYRDAFYVPERITIVLAGKITPGTFSLLEKTFGTVHRPGGRDVAFDPFCPPTRLRDPVSFQHKKTQQAQVGIAFYGVPLGHTDLPAASLLATIVGGTMSSRLFIQIRERRGLCYSISASHQAREDVGVFHILAGLERSRVKNAVRGIFDELKSVMRTGVTREELQRAKDHIRGRSMLAFENSAHQAEWYGRQWLFQHQVETPEEKMKHWECVTAPDIRRVAQTLFRPAAMAAAVIGPFASAGTVRNMFVW